jgi:hypothetical protein
MAFLLPGGVRLTPCEAHVCFDTLRYRPGFAFLAGKQKFSLISASATQFSAWFTPRLILLIHWQKVETSSLWSII